MDLRSDIQSVMDMITGKDRGQASRDFSLFAMSTMNALSGHSCVLDDAGVILMVDQGWRELCSDQFPNVRDGFLGFNYLETCEAAAGPSSTCAAALANGIRSVIAGKRSGFTFEYPGHTATEEYWFNARVTSFYGDHRHVEVSHENITARKLAERTLNASFLKGKYLETALNEHLLLTITDLKGRITYVNANFCAALQYSAEEMLGQKHRIISADYRHQGQIRALCTTIAQGQIWKGETRNRAKDGSVRWLDATVVPFPDVSGRTYQYVTICTDITQRKKNEDALFTSNEELRALAIHLGKIQEYERKRIAREIHDELGQLLLSLKMDVSMLYARTTSTHPRLNKKVSLVLEGIDATMKSVKAIINDLRPPALDFGLSAAIRSHVQSFKRRTGITCELAINDDDIELDNDCVTTLFRILQESLVNVTRHSQASQVRIDLHRDAGNISINVSDNGAGVTRSGYKRRGSYGLVGMRERINALGGEFSIEQVAGGGTRLTASVPIQLSAGEKN